MGTNISVEFKILRIKLISKDFNIAVNFLKIASYRIMLIIPIVGTQCLILLY